jgi:nicotinamidase/pyrazinamidase
MASATSPTFWDVDTQVDFMRSEGRLYVPDAESILPNLRRLTAYARARGILVMGSVDYHDPNDPEISGVPDFDETFPPHCLAGSRGQEKVPETAPRNPLWVPCEPQDPAVLRELVRRHVGEVFLRKQRFDVFSNPNLPIVLDVVGPTHLVLYGVALDVCDACAIEGFLGRGDVRLSLVLDATRPIYAERAERMVANWRERGVTILTTDDAVAGRTEGT